MTVGLISLVSWLLLSSSSAEAVNRYEGEGDDFFWNLGKDAHLRYVRALDEPSSSGVPPIRLVNGSTPLEGRVEIKLKGQWGTMCAKRADVFTAKVICRQLGYFGNAEVLEYAYFGQGSGPVWLQPFCRGDELSVDECPNFGWNRTIRCGEGSHEFDLAVGCGAAAAHSVRLVNGSSPAEGRIEVFYQGKWGTVCGTNATFDLAIVACRQLGYRETVALKTNAYFGRGSGPVWLEPACYAGINSTVVDCIHAGWGETACDHSQDVGVICSETIPVRLVNGKRASEGRIELLHNGEWGTICNYYTDINVGHVVCRELGYPGADKITTYAAFGEGKGHVLLAPKCIGNETTLLHCEHTGWGRYERHCDHSHDSGVICIDESLPTDKALQLSVDSSSSLLASILVPVIFCCVVFNGVVVGATAYVIIRRQRRRQNQTDTPMFGVLSLPSAENQKEIGHEEVADEQGVEHSTTTDCSDDTEKFF